ncbi:Putative multidrug export ATP-binding/permease protein [Sporomusa ovata DSM 2662]|uniref:Lipid A export ATP-binding/permease protein MsbA n=1 Tax=Sporomusa ovata TaxID=2378 RepID=A0A0U1KZ90_9FIRM|nr:ABC transporter ATP-binding protein [Sporomusa ovata]EQB29163.1 lipid A export ATP-binding/permease protein MsbA [Sporomusa ovata DSM 2662]CQR72595.1 Lipid A export ATP-binding/permease protein MsbA [Sporomusa ovata]
MFSFYWRKFIVPYWLLALTAVLCFIVASLAGLAAPLVVKLLIDDALTSGNIAFLHLITAGIIILYFIRGLFSYFYGCSMAKAGNKMLAKLRQDMFSKLQSLDYAYFMKTPSGELISLFTNDLLFIQQAVTVGIPDAIVESLNLLAIMAIMIYFDWELAMVTFATLPFIIIAISFFNNKVGRLGVLVEHTLAKVTAIIQQSLISIIVVQSYVREGYEYKKFSEKIQQAANELLKAQRLSAILVSLVEFLAAIGLTIIVWYGGREVIQGDLSIGGMFAFLVYIINIPMPVRKISQALTYLKLGAVAWGRINSLLNEHTSSVVDGYLQIPTAEGLVEFKDVSFAYQAGKPVLEDINIHAKPGEVIAIVGPSGAGKSSFANLLLRFYDPDKGAVYLDGINIKKLKIGDLRRQIGFIQQEPVLFNTTILENLRYGRPNATISQIEQAVRLSNAYDFIMSLPLGYDTIVGELGGNLSGGQRQRIAIARAIIMEPAILLFDEPTAALDAHTEKQVMSAIRQASTGRTVFIITHRMSTIMASDRVVYLTGGRVAETGTHQELIDKGGLYARAVRLDELELHINP